MVQATLAGLGLGLGLDRTHRAPLETSLSCFFLTFTQVLIQIIDAASVITWDFDICKGDVVFNIYHSKRAPQLPRKDPLGAHGISSPGVNNVQLIDKSWTLGQDYSMVESPLTCKEGESVQVGGASSGAASCLLSGSSSPPSLPQGSHITRWPGFYILQWRFHNTPACAATNLPRVDDVLATLQVSSHKCKVMYYTELLGSEDFRSVSACGQLARAGGHDPGCLSHACVGGGSVGPPTVVSASVVSNADVGLHQRRL